MSGAYGVSLWKGEGREISQHAHYKKIDYTTAPIRGGLLCVPLPILSAEDCCAASSPAEAFRRRRLFRFVRSAEDFTALCAAPKFDLFVHDAGDCSTFCEAPRISPLTASAENFTPHGKRREFHPSQRSAGDLHPSQRNAGDLHPSKRSAGDLHPSKRSAGDLHPSQRSAGDLHPSQRSAGDLHPSQRSAGDLHPSQRSAGDCCVWLKKSSEPPFTECCER